MKNKFRTLLVVAVLALGLMSCDKEDTVAPKDYTTYTVDASLNSKDGKLSPKMKPGTHTPEMDKDGKPVMVAQFFYSAQYLFNLSKEELVAKVNSDESYVKFIIPTNPKSDLKENLTAEGDWTIALTQYVTEMPYKDGTEMAYMKYAVTGALINTAKGVQAVKVEDENFDTITLADAEKNIFSSEITTIGYDWKKLDFQTLSYKIVKNSYYLVKLENDNIFKLRFIDFYNAKGEKGNVKFQFQLLK